MNECRYELKTPFKYSYKGEMVDANFITMTAPNFKQHGHYTPIKQAFTAAITEIQTKDEGVETGTGVEKTESVDAAAVMQIMYSWSGDLKTVFSHAEQLFKNGGALVEGEANLTIPLMEKMAMADFEGLVGTYIANFIVPSLMDGQ